MKSQEHGIHEQLELSKVSLLKMKFVLNYLNWRINPWLDWSVLVNSLNNVSACLRVAIVTCPYWSKMCLHFCQCHRLVAEITECCGGKQSAPRSTKWFWAALKLLGPYGIMERLMDIHTSDIGQFIMNKDLSSPSGRTWRFFSFSWQKHDQ